MKEFLTLDGHENIALCKLCGARLSRVECPSYGWRMVHADPSDCIGKSWVSDMNKLRWKIKNIVVPAHLSDDELWRTSLRKHVGYHGNIRMVERVAKHPAFVRSCIDAFERVSRTNRKKIFKENGLLCKWVLSARIHRLIQKNTRDIVGLATVNVIDEDIECAFEMVRSSGIWEIIEDKRFSYLFNTGASIDTSFCCPVLIPDKIVK